MGPTARPPDGHPLERPSLALPSLIYLGLGVVLLSGALSGWERIGAKEWGWFLGQTQAEIDSLRQWGQFPYWMPWRRGGQVGYAQPESMFLSPVTPLALLVGALAAYKLLLLPIHLCGCLGMHQLAGQLGLSGWSRLVPAFVFFGSSVFPLYAVGGLPNWLFALAIVPWLLFALQRALHDVRWVLLAGLLYAGLIWCGALYFFVFLPPFLGLWMLVVALRTASLRPLLLLGAALLVGVSLASPRLLATFEVYEQFPRLVAAWPDFLTLPMAWKAWTDPQLPELSGLAGPVIVLRDTAIYWIYVGGYVGPVALLLAALGALRWRTSLAPLLAGGVFLWLALGPGASPSLWKALHGLPVFSSMHWPQRLCMLTTFCLAVLAGLGWQAVDARVSRLTARSGPRAGARAVLALRALLLAGLLVPPLLVNAPIAARTFPLAPDPNLRRASEFRQGEVPHRAEQYGGNLYESVLANIGCPDAKSSIPTPRVVVRAGDPAYRGEVWLQGGRGVVHASITPSVIDVQAELDGDDTLIVNQNFFPGWRAEGSVQAPLQDTGHLLSLPLPAGRHALTLRYAPASVAHGFLLGGAALLIGFLYLLARRGAPVLSAGRPELLALLGYVGLAVAQGLPDTSNAPPRRPTREEAALASALVVDAPDSPSAGVPGSGTFRTIQAAVDAAPAGGYVRVRPGSYDGFRLDKPVLVTVQPGGSVTIRSRVEIAGLPEGQRAGLAGLQDQPLLLSGGLSVRDCAGTVVAQHVTFGWNPAGQPAGPTSPADTVARKTPLLVEHGADVFLVGCSFPAALAAGANAAIAVDTASVVAAHCTVTAAHSTEPGRAGAAGIDAHDAILLLADTSVRGGDGAPLGAGGEAGAGGPALRLHASRAVLSATPEIEVAGGLAGEGAAPAAGGPVRAPAIEASSGSRVVASGASLADPTLVAGAGEVLSVAQLPRVRVVQSRFQECTLLISLDGTPHARGMLVIGLRTAVVPVDALNFLQIHLGAQYASVPVQFPQSGRIELRMRVPGALLRPGGGAFCQVVAERVPGAGLLDFSLIDGGLFEFRER